MSKNIGDTVSDNTKVVFETFPFILDTGYSIFVQSPVKVMIEEQDNYYNSKVTEFYEEDIDESEKVKEALQYILNLESRSSKLPIIYETADYDEKDVSTIVYDLDCLLESIDDAQKDMGLVGKEEMD
jgi:hypothetical protein